MKSGEIIFEGGKALLLIDNRNRAIIPKQFGFTIDEHDGLFIDEFEVRWDNQMRSDVVVWMEVEGKRYKARSGQRPETDPEEETSSVLDPNRKPARAPYNFIPLNKEVVSAEETPTQDQYHRKRLTGHLDLTITNKTPIYIRGRKWNETKEDWVESENFFNWDREHKPVIPGSSLRGLIRCMVEVVSWSEFDKDMFEDKQLYRRSDLPSDGDDIQYGFLRKDGSKFMLREVSTLPTKNPNNKTELAYKEYHYEYDGNDCYYAVGKLPHRSIVWKFTWDKSKEEEALLKEVVHAYRQDVSRAPKAIDILTSLNRGYIVDSQKKPKKIGVSKVDVPADKGIPVFFRKENGKVISFGNAKYHRVPWKYAVHNLVSQNKPEGYKLDLVKAIFGEVADKNKDAKSTRVFFDDIELESEQSDFLELKEPDYPKILSSPKPTTYQHYLEQKSHQTPSSALKNWSHEDAEIRGFKNYWHRKTSSKKGDKHSWIEDGKITKSHTDHPINPVKAETKFKGRIRFENLTKEELGCMLFVLDLPKEPLMCLKLGLGKPLGLGSIRIELKLTLTKRKERYKKLFNKDMNDWNEGIEKDENTPLLDELKNDFAAYINDKAGISCTDWNALWENERLKYLKAMLTFEHKIENPPYDDYWLDCTRYQEIELKRYNSDGSRRMKPNGKPDDLNEYKDRRVLPYPDVVVQLFENRNYKDLTKE